MEEFEQQASVLVGDGADSQPSFVFQQILSQHFLEGIQHKLMLRRVEFDYKKGLRKPSCICTFNFSDNFNLVLELRLILVFVLLYHPGSVIWWNLTLETNTVKDY
jgi:hypothetical protein